MSDVLYHLANIRDLLLNGFDDRELRHLCQDVPDFRPVYNELARSTGKAEIVDQLLAYAERQLLIDTLLALAKEQNPSRYDRHGPYYYDDPTSALQKQVSDLAKRLAAISSPSSLTFEQQNQIAFHWRDLGGKDSLRNFSLSYADLRAADLAGADLRAANLVRVKMTTANLSGADLRLAILQGAYLTYANLGGANLAGADLAGAKLEGANLERADLRGADLREADLSGADLSRADLYKAKLKGAKLERANLTHALVEDGQLQSAKSLEGATLPDGTVHE